MNFNTAFYSKGLLRVRRSEIARHYASTWLLFDVHLDNLLAEPLAISCAFSLTGCQGKPDGRVPKARE